jgi:hypothetical protein
VNLQYNSNLPYSPPHGSRDEAAKRFMGAPNPGYGSAYADNMQAMGSANLSAYRRNADQADFDYAVGHHRGQQGLALSGLQNMDAQRQQAEQLQTGRLQNMVGALRALL